LIDSSRLRGLFQSQACTIPSYEGVRCSITPYPKGPFYGSRGQVPSSSLLPNHRSRRLGKPFTLSNRHRLPAARESCERHFGAPWLPPLLRGGLHRLTLLFYEPSDTRYPRSVFHARERNIGDICRRSSRHVT